MKRIISMLLAVCMVLPLFGCGKDSDVQQPDSQPEAAATEAAKDPVLDTFLEDWMNLLVLRERCLAQEQYTLELILTLEEAPTWENRVYAQTASSFTCEMIDYLAQHEAIPAMTDADYQELIGRGMDLGDVQAEYQLYNDVTRLELAQTASPIWRDGYLQRLMYDSFDDRTMTMLLASAKVRLKATLADMKSLYLVNNFIMLELPQEASRKLMDLAAEHAPSVMALYDRPLGTTAEVLSEMDRVNRELEECLLEQEEITSAWDLLLEDPTQTPATIDGLPQLIPFPECISMEGWNVQHYWKSGEEIKTADYRMKMDTVPNNMFMELENVPVEAYYEYVLQLTDTLGNPADMNDTAALFALADGAQMVVSYEEGGVTIYVTDGLVCFAPAWYIQTRK